MRSIGLSVFVLSAIALAQPGAAQCCQSASAPQNGHSHTVSIPDHVHYISAPAVQTTRSTQISVENGVRVFRPSPTVTSAPAGQFGPSDAEIYAARRAVNNDIAAQNARLDALEARQDRIEDAQDAQARRRHGFTDGYGYIYPRPVYFLGDPRFAGPYGYSVAPRQVPLFVPGLGTVPAPQDVGRRNYRPHKR